jgi:hypothetical protein
MASLSLAAFAQCRVPREDTVWVAECRSGRPLGLNVLLADSLVYHTSLQVCKRERTEIPQRQWHFSFTSTKALQWANDSTVPGEAISGDIWQAGGDSDALLLGVTMFAHNQILVNSIHVSSAQRASVTPIDAILVVRTTP